MFRTLMVSELKCLVPGKLLENGLKGRSLETDMQGVDWVCRASLCKAVNKLLKGQLASQTIAQLMSMPLQISAKRERVQIDLAFRIVQEKWILGGKPVYGNILQKTDRFLLPAEQAEADEFSGCRGVIWPPYVTPDAAAGTV